MPISCFIVITFCYQSPSREAEHPQNPKSPSLPQTQPGAARLPGRCPTSANTDPPGSRQKNTIQEPPEPHPGHEHSLRLSPPRNLSLENPQTPQAHTYPRINHSNKGGIKPRTHPPTPRVVFYTTLEPMWITSANKGEPTPLWFVTINKGRPLEIILIIIFQVSVGINQNPQWALKVLFLRGKFQICQELKREKRETRQGHIPRVKGTMENS